jgi:hypothetical protein
MMSPHGISDGMLFITHSIGIDGRCRELGMTKPLLHKIEWHTGCDSGHAKPMAQSFWTCMASTNSGLGHHLTDATPTCHAALRPQTVTSSLIRSRLKFAQSMHQIKHVDECMGYRNGPIYSSPSFLERLEDNQVCPEVNPIRREQQGFG